jgi:hypothetical protein
MKGLEIFKDGDQILSLLIRAQADPKETTFFTPNEFYQQAGFVVYPAGGKITSHTHLPIKRNLIGTPETLFVRKGKLIARFFNSAHEQKGEVVIQAGDVLMLVSGGHGFTVIEDSVLLEIKQGPYTGLQEKESFDDPG